MFSFRQIEANLLEYLVLNGNAYLRRLSARLGRPSGERVFPFWSAYLRLLRGGGGNSREAARFALKNTGDIRFYANLLTERSLIDLIDDVEATSKLDDRRIEEMVVVKGGGVKPDTLRRLAWIFAPRAAVVDDDDGLFFWSFYAHLYKHRAYRSKVLTFPIFVSMERGSFSLARQAIDARIERSESVEDMRTLYRTSVLHVKLADGYRCEGLFPYDNIPTSDAWQRMLIADDEVI